MAKKLRRRGNLAWMLVMSTAALVMIAGEGVPAFVGASFLGGLLLYAAFANRASNPVRDRRIAEQGLAMRKEQTTSAARMATHQARNHPDYDGYTYLLRDIGVIVDETGAQGVKLRQVRFLSLDNDAIRPYVVLETPRRFTSKQVVVRFEIIDAGGVRQFIYEMEHILVAGENLLLPDYRLLLKGNPRLNSPGKWTFQVWVNDGVVGIHSFNVSPSLEERRQQFGADGEAQRTVRLETEPLPMSLEDLLAQQNKQSSTHN